ncbi:MAG: ABC transporter substrate-binding protein [Methyloprofundus sp.]|nr:ABC transporter substrate-binding protein [Methyloprofundus sp.]
MKRFFALMLIMIVTWFAFIEYEKQPAISPSHKTVKIGVIAPFSGLDSFRGNMGMRGIEIAQQLIPYLDNGDAIEWIKIDDQNQPEKSVAALKALVESHKVAAVFMLSASNSALAVAKIAEQFKTPVFVVLASHPDISEYSPYIKQFNFDDTFQAAVAAFYVRDELRLDRVAIINKSDNAHFDYLAKEFSKQFTSTEGVMTDHYDLAKQPDILPLLQSMQVKDPELLYLPMPVQFVFQVKLALLELGWNPKIMLSDGIFAGIKAQTQHPKELMNDALAVDTFSYDLEFTPLGERLLKQASVMGLSVDDISTSSALSMEAYVLLVELMNQCIAQKNKPLCLHQRVGSIHRFEGVKGLITFEGGNKAHRSLAINEIVDGQVEFVVQVY